jgi:hypothetical protein
MLRLFVLLAFVLLTGCCGGALPVTTSDAMSIVWEGAYGMEVSTRPSVVWHVECRLDDWGASRPRAVGGEHGCVTMEMFFDTGVADLQTADRPSDSSFTLALAHWKAHLLGTDPNGVKMAAAKRALVAAGL